MSGVKQHNPNSRATEIIAALALREQLHSIERICDEQKQISTGRLYAYATEAGDKLAGYACELRQAITSLRQDHTEAQRLLRENDALAQRCKELEGLLAEATAQREFLDKQQSDACFRREKAESERNTLRAEVAQLRREASLYRFVRGLAWYVDRAASVYELGNSQSPWSSERQAVDADEVEAAIAAAMEELT